MSNGLGLTGAGAGSPPELEQVLEERRAGVLGPLHVDLGKSYQQRRPVLTILSERLPRTLALALCAVFLQVGPRARTRYPL